MEHPVPNHTLSQKDDARYYLSDLFSAHVHRHSDIAKHDWEKTIDKLDEASIANIHDYWTQSIENYAWLGQDWPKAGFRFDRLAFCLDRTDRVAETLGNERVYTPEIAFSIIRKRFRTPDTFLENYTTTQRLIKQLRFGMDGAPRRRPDHRILAVESALEQYTAMIKEPLADCYQRFG
jgi:hypothetical protein